MALIINGKVYSGVLTQNLVSTMVSEIKKLPEPTVVSRDDSRGIEENQIGLCLQREVIYVDKTSTENKIKYIGSKDVYTCILVYIHNKTDHMAIHVDNVNTMDIGELLEHFKNKDGIMVTLVGGAQGPVADGNLKNIVTRLFEAAIKNKIDITITHQKIMANNIFTNEDRFEFIFDKIIMKADILSRQYFNKPLDLTRFAEKLVKDMQERRVTMNDSLQLIAVMLNKAVEIYDVSSKSERTMLETMFKQNIKSENDFLNAVDSMFSKEGFSLLNMSYERFKMYNDSKLTHFAIDIESGKVHQIASHTYTPYEEQRSIAVIDCDRAQEYFVCYKGNEYFSPQLSNAFLKKCDSVKSLDGINRLDFCKKFEINNHVPTINMVGKFIKSMQNITAAKNETDNTRVTQNVSSDVTTKNSTLNPASLVMPVLLQQAKLTMFAMKEEKDYSPRDVVDIYGPQQEPVRNNKL